MCDLQKSGGGATFISSAPGHQEPWLRHCMTSSQVAKMAVGVTRLLRSCCHVCLLLSFLHAIGPTVSRDVKTKESPDVLPAACAVTTLAHDVTRNAVLLRPTAAADDVIRTAAANDILRL